MRCNVLPQKYLIKEKNFKFHQTGNLGTGDSYLELGLFPGPAKYSLTILFFFFFDENFDHSFDIHRLIPKYIFCLSTQANIKSQEDSFKHMFDIRP